MLPKTVGHYVIGDCIGKGGNGEVYRAHDTHLDRRVAIKVVRDRHWQDAAARRRLRFEALAAASLDHPFLCKVYELTEVDGCPAIVMEYVDGETLAERLDAQRLELADLLRIGRGVAEALGAAHERGLVHRDIKPSNVMLTRHGHVKVLDFGVAKELNDLADDDSTDLTAPGTAVGTPRFMSPEQARGESVDQRSDVFSLGILLYFASTGRYPFTGDRPHEYLANLVAEPPAPLEPGATEGLVRVVGRCLAKDPAHRYANGLEVAAALRALTEPSLSVGAPVPALASTSGRRRFAIAAALAAGAITAGVVITRPLSRPEPASIVGVAAPIATSAEREQDVRIDPTGAWHSFLTSNGGRTTLWLAASEGGNLIPLDELEGRVTGHVWSPDGKQIAYVTDIDETYYLRVIPMSGGAALTSIELGDNRPHSYPIRWLNRYVYVGRREGLQRVDLDSRSAAMLSGSWDDLRIRSADIHDDGSRIVVAAFDPDGQPDLWILDLDAATRERLTDDPDREIEPRWWATGEERIVYVLQDSGRAGAWRHDIRSGATVPIMGFPGLAEEVAVSADGTRLLATIRRESADVLRVDTQTGTTSTLTDDSRGEFGASINTTTELATFQQARLAVPGFQTTFDSQILVGTWTRDQLRDPRVVVTEGFGPELAPELRALAYLRDISAGTGAGNAELWVRDLGSQQDRQVADNVLIGGFAQFPFAWKYSTWAWLAADLAFLSIDSTGTSRLHWQSWPATRPDQVLAQAGPWPGAFLSDLTAANGGDALAYVEQPRAGLTRVFVVDRNAQPFRIATLDGEELRLVGWTPDDSGVVALELRTMPDGSTTGDVVRLGRDGSATSLGTIDRVFAGNVRSDPWGQRLVWTKLGPGPHDLWIFDLADGSTRAITRNDRASVTFSEPTFMSDGSIVFSRYELSRDVWVLEL